MDNAVIVHTCSGDCSCVPLEELLQEKVNFEPVFLGDKDFYKRMTSMQKYRLLDSLTLSFSIDMLKYNPGGNVGNVVFVWRVPESRTESEMMTDAVRMAVKLKPSLPEYHTRQQRIEFASAYGNLAKISPAVRRSLYTELTGDCTASPNPEMDTRLRLVLLGESPDLIYDLRQLNTGRVPSFEVFFEEMGKVIEEWVAVDERRHGVMHFSNYLSLPDLCSKVKSRCPPDTPVPSLDLVRLQFWPKSPSAHAALRFSGRFEVKYKIQVRQLRQKHIDNHYAAALFKYMREFAINKYREHSTLVFADDKAKINVGEPGALVSTGVRGKKTLAPVSTDLSALDHDMQSLSSLTPSVTMFCDVPESIENSFYRGDVRVCLKDAVFQASSPFRHGTELQDLMKRRGDVPPILLLYTDGGCDHCLTYSSVKCALICLFLELDLDMLIAARTAPGHSWANPVERVMSLLNLAIQNVAVARDSMDEEIEKKIKSCSTMADIRKLANTVPNAKRAWTASLKNVVELLESRFERLSLKGQPVSTEESAEDAEIDKFSRHILKVDPSVDLNHLQQKDVSKCKDLQKFLSTHTRSRHYSFQIKKCSEESCEHCKSPRLPLDNLHWLPDPESSPLDPNRYLSFSTLFGKDTSEKFRPSLKTTSEDTFERSSVSFSAQRARNVIICGECLKPRIVYSQYSLSPVEKECIEKAKESADYVCGSQLLPVTHNLYPRLCVRTKLDCSSPIESAYYSSNLSLPLICYYCGCFNAERDPDLLKSFRSVMPLCSECKSSKPAVTKLPFPK